MTQPRPTTRRTSRPGRVRRCRLITAVQRAWRTHRQRVADDPAYADTFAATVLSAVGLATRDARAHLVAHELVAAYVQTAQASASARTERLRRPTPHRPGSPEHVRDDPGH